ncbi:hypothetical protein EDD27_0843 [Nonomuraea polychroma]|uniref:Uncharacterized protein n=1 Tax=Nonomuraea polychroma TaxID=46176 RepID=A0A438LYD0_9ACTN|nr:hypothetical protein EDD27_0843 [Nonomuraea polychroma]
MTAVVAAVIVPVVVAVIVPVVVAVIVPVVVAVIVPVVVAVIVPVVVAVIVPVVVAVIVPVVVAVIVSVVVAVVTADEVMGRMALFLGPAFLRCSSPFSPWCAVQGAARRPIGRQPFRHVQASTGRGPRQPRVGGDP